MKRLILILLTAAMLLFALSSCNKQENDPGDEKYTDNYVYTTWRTSQDSVSTLYRINVLTGTGVPVCPDPLCSHAIADFPFYSINTNGFKIIGKYMFFMRQGVPLKYHKQVCRFDIEFGKLDVIYENDAATIADLFVFEDYVYFTEFVSGSGDGENPIYDFDLLRYGIKNKKIVNLGESGLTQNALAYACVDGKVYWHDYDNTDNYFSTDIDNKNRIDGDRYENLMFEGDYNVDSVIGDEMEYPVENIRRGMNVISRKISTGEETVILKNTPAFPMVYDGKVFHFEYQEVPLIVGYWEDENGEKTANPIYDPRWYKLYVCGFDGSNDRLLCDIEKSGYCFVQLNNMLGKPGSGDYFVLRVVGCRPSGDGVSLETSGSAIMIININTGEYIVAEME